MTTLSLETLLRFPLVMIPTWGWGKELELRTLRVKPRFSLATKVVAVASKHPESRFFDHAMLAMLEKAFDATWPVPEGHGPVWESPHHADLTPKERLVLAEILMGLSSKEVARSLEISPRTVEFHRANLLKKYGAKNTADLLRRVLG